MFDTKQIKLLDKFAISSSTLCAIHCVALPFIVGVFPAIGASIFADEAFHHDVVGGYPTKCLWSDFGLP